MTEVVVVVMTPPLPSVLPGGGRRGDGGGDGPGPRDPLPRPEEHLPARPEEALHPRGALPPLALH